MTSNTLWISARYEELIERSVKWANPETLNGLKDTFAHYGRQDAAVALKASMDVFRKTALETARKLNFEYPTDAHRRIAEWIEACLSNDQQMRGS
jgi:hypothetical protein